MQVTEDNEGFTTLLKCTLMDIGGKEKFTTNYKAGCKNGLYFIDMLRFFDMGKLAEQNQDDLELVIDGSVLYFPVNAKAGYKLEDGDINIKLNKEDFTLITMSFYVFNRTVLPNETITTGAGTFDCQVVTFDFESKFGMIKIKGSGKEWYDESRAVIKSESYNKNKKLQGYHELTSIR